MAGKRFGVALAAAVLLTSTAQADLISVSASKDVTLYQHPFGEDANGAGDHFFAGLSAFDNARRALLHFDITSAVPADATINSASLRLNMSRCGPTCLTDVQIDLHRLLADWGEGASDAELQEGIPAPAEPGDATWVHTFYDTDYWIEQGGDYSPVLSTSRIVTDLGFYTWPSTPQFVADVQNMLDNPASNFGWLLRAADELETLTAKRFDSRTNPNPSFWPVLTIDYTPIPEPSTLLFVTLGTAAVLRFNRRR